MNEPSLIGRQRTLLRDLVQLTAEKAESEPALARSFHTAREIAEKAFAEASESLRKRFTADKDALDRKLRQNKEGIESRWTAEQAAAQNEYTETRGDMSDQFDAEREVADTACQEARWTAEAVFESVKNNAATLLREETARLTSQWKEMQSLCKQGRGLLEEWNQPAGDIEEAARKTANTKSIAPVQTHQIADCLQEAKTHLAGLRELVVPRFLKGRRLLWLTLLLWLVLIFPLGWLLTVLLKRSDPGLGILIALGAVVGALVSFAAERITRLVLGSVARKQVSSLYRPLCDEQVEVETLREQLLKQLQADHDQTTRDAQKRYRTELMRAQNLQKVLDEIDTRRTTGFAKLEERLKNQFRTGEQRRAGALVAAEKRHKQDATQLVLRYETDMRELDAHHRAQLAEIDSLHLGQWQATVKQWQKQLQTIQESVVEIRMEADTLFPRWQDPLWQKWKPPSALPPVMRFGAYKVPAESIVEDVPWLEPRPEPDRYHFRLPALCSFPEPASILFHTANEGQNQAVESLRTIMFRLLTSLPPGRVRFLIVDPVGLGQNFAAFMNLADYDEALVGSRIWTEAGHIEQRLADLTAHMENVIQKYLRNRYATISEYNTYAGEVAEPFRVLVVANFPTNFSTEAARRLVSIAQSGPRGGVSTLISIDGRQTPPKGFEQADLERCGENLEWDGNQFRWRDKDFGSYLLKLDGLPDDDFCNRILQQVGEGAKNAQRVEVPFEFIAPTAEQWWQGSTRQGISVPLGRAGATRRQLMELGKGTSQHVLIVGKTGSGKSTLLHALITNLALFYSPDEIELYLIDFKKGVEFKTYASHNLPHARVVAIESEREFGLSVLQRLDVELQGRGERFRAADAQDLSSYRLAVPAARLPRVMLIVDEFQEFFVEDDRIAHEAGQLLDRLVRQGRAFGMHILLGSQTIGGAYSLARSTIDQMAVRIALQCSEADAALILSDDNSAARLLSRPGEAIYNNANGLVEGNDPFQVVWLSESQREQYLLRIHELQEQRPLKPRSPAVIFEGNADADVTKNDPLNQLLGRGAAAVRQSSSSIPDAETAWLGEAMAIDELTAAEFRRQNGSNLLIVGQQPEAALGMLATGLISLAAHGRPSVEAPRFFVVDGNQPDAPRTGVLARLSEVIPEPIKVVGWRELSSVLTELTAELDRRQKTTVTDAPALYLVLYAMQRMRDLRRAEDDFGFGRSEEKPATPDKQLATLLREGSALGVHTMIWCDTLNNLQRALDRQAMRELALRVVFQFSVADSSNLIDNPAASKLGIHRALFSSEEDGRLEKFRPYGIPSEEWLGWVREKFQQRIDG